MYYIINETHHIIAADEKLLELCGFSEINELTSNITLEKISLKTIPNNQVTITTELKSHSFPITYTSLSSLLGKLTLITLDTSKSTAQTIVDESIDIESLIIKSKVPDDLTFINDIEKEITSEKDLPSEIPLDEIPSFAPINTQESIKYDKEEEPISILDTSLDLLSLDIENTPTMSIEDRQLSPTANIIVDVTEVSKSIGVSEEDFTLFLNEYIDTALDLEKDLQSNDTKTCSSAINALLHLSEVLHLDEVNQILQDIAKSDNDTHMYHVTSFYDALSRITTKKDIAVVINPEKKEEEIEDIVLLDLLIDDDIQDSVTLLDTKENTPIVSDIEILSKSISEDIPTELIIEPIIETIPILETEPIAEIKPPLKLEESSTPAQKKDAIDLSDISPIHFDFQISVAADELSLPQSLIEEFMVDFIEQAHIETDKMLLAYQTGDLDSIQKIGHLLKGVSSNLRITTLSDTLYKIQFSKEIDEIPDFVKTYWGHFLFFEKQIKRLAN